MIFLKMLYKEAAVKGLWRSVQATAGKPVDTQGLTEVLPRKMLQKNGV
jgi:hypothetical protein